jgi:hypothetical protein
MDLEFMQPAPALARHVSIYYRMRVDFPLIEDLERADVGYLRFLISGKGSITYASGHRDPEHPVILMGPATETGRYTLSGPLDCFGCVLLPDFWGGIADLDATAAANRSLDGSLTLGSESRDLFDRLSDMTTINDMATATDAFLVRRIKPLPKDDVAVIDTIGAWLSCFPIPAPDALYNATARGPRSVLRLANRHFGAPPKMLARKFRALRTASRLVGTKGMIPHELIDEYSDRAHLTREIRQFTGLTPRQLQVNSNPIVRATLHPDNFRADAPWT